MDSCLRKSAGGSYISGELVIKAKSSPNVNVSVIETQYGKMLKVEAENANWVTIASFISSERTIDIVNSNMTLLLYSKES